VMALRAGTRNCCFRLTRLVRIETSGLLVPRNKQQSLRHVAPADGAALAHRKQRARSVMKMAADDAPTDWIINIEETSAGVYRVYAEDVRGRTVELSGTDPAALRIEALRQIGLLQAP
jgi:hypothetical protein